MSNNATEQTAGWQPIETAPKDGSEIVALTSDGAWIVTWRDRVGGWQIKKPAGRDPIVCLGNMLGWLPLPCEDLVSDNPSKQTAGWWTLCSLFGLLTGGIGILLLLPPDGRMPIIGVTNLVAGILLGLGIRNGW